MSYRLLHRIVIALLIVSALWNLSRYVLVAPELSLKPFVVLAIWGVFLWAVITRPKKGGQWVGIALIVMIAGHLFLWWRALQHPDAPFDLAHAGMWARSIAYEFTLAVTAGFCLRLRFVAEEGKTKG